MNYTLIISKGNTMYQIPDSIPSEWVTRFIDRTGKHIKLVTKCGKYLAPSINSFNPDGRIAFEKRIEKHDESKLKQPEVLGYIVLTEKYRCKNEGLKFKCPPVVTEEDIDNAWKIHASNNRHHPEYFGNKLHQMGVIDIAEMLCDIKAMSIELKDDFYGFICTNTLTKYKWDIRQIGLIKGFASILNNMG